MLKITVVGDDQVSLLGILSFQFSCPDFRLTIGWVSAPGGGGGTCSREGAWSGGAWWGICSGGGVPGPGGVVSQHALRQPPPCGQNDRQV